MPVTRAVIPAAGLGKRMLPLSRAMPKEMLPVVDRPVIQHVVDEAMLAGIEQIGLVLSRDKSRLADSIVTRATIVPIDQPVPGGLGDAVLRARDFAGDEPFLCLNGDTLFDGSVLPARQLLDAHREFQCTVIGLEVVPDQRVHRYGIVQGDTLREGVVQVRSIIEKPDARSTPSRLAIAARYVLTRDIFDSLQSLHRCEGSELQLAEALNDLASRQRVIGVLLQSRRFDIGTPRDWLLANVELSLRDPETRRAVQELLDRPG
jgi:UTP--glucose-1-phosphate uridylyltransferase